MHDMRLHRQLGQAEATGDLFLGDSFDLTEQHDFAAPGWQGEEGLREEGDFLPRTRRLGHTGSIIQDGQHV